MVFLDVLDVFLKVYDTFLQCLKILLGELVLRNTAVVLYRADSSHENNGIRMDPRLAALNIKEFLCAEICAESCLCDRHIRKL